MRTRSSGILLPIPSLPSRFGIGDLGPDAYKFADFLQAAKQSVWQLLPLNPTVFDYGHSPYHSLSAFAFNPLLISPEWMQKDGFIEKADLEKAPKFPEHRIDYRKTESFKERLFDCAFKRFRPDEFFCRFCSQHALWLDDFALFTAFKRHFNNRAWNRWPPRIRNRDPQALQLLASQMEAEVTRIKFLQYLFFIQWNRLKRACNHNGIHIFGDIPIYVPYDSADVWANPELFKLDRHKRPVALSGVPPDYFSDTGQLWGHPVYQWETHRRTGYAWWIDRIAHNLELFDYVRIDHFRGLVAFWEVPANKKTALKGKWAPAPVEDFMDSLSRRFPCLPLIAEDLGYITADVRETMRRFDIPGMRVLVFGFMGDLARNPNAPHNIEKNCVVYTGTHDTNTVRGWFEAEIADADREQLFRYLGRTPAAEELPWELIRLAMMSPAELAIIPMQDLMGLDARARINRPGSSGGNWRWRMTKSQATAAPAERLRQLTEIYGRAP